MQKQPKQRTPFLHGTCQPPALFPATNRKRIAVLDLKHRNDCCRVGNVKINGEAISEELTAGISSYLVQTRKFTVLDRAYESQTNLEQERLMSDDVPITELAKLGQELVSDYVLVGTLNNLSLSTSPVAFNHQRIRETNPRNVQKQIMWFIFAYIN